MQHKSVDSGELRNRVTGRRVGFVAQQQLLNLNAEEILGVYALNNVLYVLTENTINTVLIK